MRGTHPPSVRRQARTGGRESEKKGTADQGKKKKKTTNQQLSFPTIVRYDVLELWTVVSPSPSVHIMLRWLWKDVDFIIRTIYKVNHRRKERKGINHHLSNKKNSTTSGSTFCSLWWSNFNFQMVWVVSPWWVCHEIVSSHCQYWPHELRIVSIHFHRCNNECCDISINIHRRKKNVVSMDAVGGYHTSYH